MLRSYKLLQISTVVSIRFATDLLMFTWNKSRLIWPFNAFSNSQTSRTTKFWSRVDIWGVYWVRRLNAALFTEPPIPINGVQIKTCKDQRLRWRVQIRVKAIQVLPLVIHANPKTLTQVSLLALLLIYLEIVLVKPKYI